MKKGARIGCTIVLFAVEIIILMRVITLSELEEFVNNSSWWIDLFSLTAPVPLLYTVNYYMLAPAVFILPALYGITLVTTTTTKSVMEK